MPGNVELSWPQARDLATGGAYIRRINWLDRWWFRTRVLWWRLDIETNECHVIRGHEISAVEMSSRDWTTIWPDQRRCVYPDEPAEQVPEPQPEPAGPVVIPLNFKTETNMRPGGHYGSGQKFGVRKVENPFDGPATVVLFGHIDDTLWIGLPKATTRSFPVLGGGTVELQVLSGKIVWTRVSNTTQINYSFVLGKGQSFSISVSNDYGGACWYYLTATFTP